MLVHGTWRHDATSSDSSSWPRPATRKSFFLVTMSTRGSLLAPILARDAGWTVGVGRHALHRVVGGNGVGDEGARAGLRAVAQLDRRPQRGVDARVNVVADLGAVLVDAV